MARRRQPGSSMAARRTEPNDAGRQYRHSTLSAYTAGKCRCEHCRGAYTPPTAPSGAPRGRTIRAPHAPLTMTSIFLVTGSAAASGTGLPGGRPRIQAARTRPQTRAAALLAELGGYAHRLAPWTARPGRVPWIAEGGVAEPDPDGGDVDAASVHEVAPCRSG
jgi:hypothetical protein